MVVLSHDIPFSGLKAGDLGAVMQVYETAALEVEFVTASGRTQVLLTLRTEDVRPVRDAFSPSDPRLRSADHPKALG
ncbi:MAG TPA: DUF4926 domain-containing protein [Candidatus Sumerlaeota bacterium]|nr:DUF4926 domain-containing protein [Candidatus Sumerlaeota bacterium]HOR28287.1 DUF4926 domain-containing protein [Candidatus Sumerlaeota bacterium]HPK03332.1 DUF4926 domain-containing protein [Candidatus Sumerlaeota bacterium]